jgi:hypothetical protein
MVAQVFHAMVLGGEGVLAGGVRIKGRIGAALLGAPHARLGIQFHPLPIKST